MTTYEEMLEKYGKCEGMVGENSEGETVILSIDDEAACTTTSQTNGWHRINIWYKDGSWSESYEK